MIVGPRETLYRGIYESGHKKLAIRNMVPQEVFDNGTCSISTDRADHAPRELLLDLGASRAKVRKPLGKRSFYGWVSLTAADAAKDGRRVDASEQEATDDLPANAYQADIVLADDPAEDERRSECSALASISTWVKSSPREPIKSTPPPLQG